MAGDKIPQITSASEWRKPREKGVEITLTYSGNTVRLRPVDVTSLLRSGEIPDLLSLIAYASLYQEQDMEKVLGDHEMIKNWDKILSIVVPAAFLEPKVAEAGKAPEEDEIELEDIHLYDRMEVFNIATAGARALYLFRSKQSADDDVVSNGQNNKPKAKRVSRAK